MGSGWAEWDEIKANLREGEAVSVQLAGEGKHVPGMPAGTEGVRLVVTPAMLRTAADQAGEVAEDFAKADNSTMKETGEVGASLEGFDSGPTFAVLQERWRGQMRYMQSLLAQDLAPNLRQTAMLLQNGDISAENMIMKGSPK